MSTTAITIENITSAPQTFEDTYGNLVTVDAGLTVNAEVDDAELATLNAKDLTWSISPLVNTGVTENVTLINGATAVGYGAPLVMGNYDMLKFSITGKNITGLEVDFFSMNPVTGSLTPCECTLVGSTPSIAVKTTTVPAVASVAGSASPSHNLSAVTTPVGFRISAYGDIAAGITHLIELSAVAAAACVTGAEIATAVQGAIQAIYPDITCAYTTIYTVASGQEGQQSLIGITTLTAADIASGIVDLSVASTGMGLTGAGITVTQGTGETWETAGMAGWSFVPYIKTLTGTSAAVTVAGTAQKNSL